MADSFHLVHDHSLTATANGAGGTYGVLHNDMSMGGGALSVSAVNGNAASVGQTITLASGASLALNADGGFLYISAPHSAYTDTFGYTATNGVDSASTTVTIAVTNTAPLVSNGSPLGVLRNNLTQRIDLSQNASDAEGDSLQFTIVTQPSHGTLYPSGGSNYVYMSSPSYTGQDSFGFKANDGIADSNTATFSLAVGNTAPTAANTGVYSVLKNKTLIIGDLNTYGNDVSTDTLTPTIVQQPAHGQLVSSGTGQFQYTPNTDYVGQDSFTYKLNDGVADSTAATASINVVDQPIVANNVHKPIGGDDPFVISTADLLTNAQSSMLGATLQVTSVSSPQLGQVADNGNGTWTYTPPSSSSAPFNGQDTFAFSVSDGAKTATANFTLFVPDRNRTDLEPSTAYLNRRLAHMQNQTQLFPAGVTLAAYNAMNAADQAALNNRLANSIEQGYLGGDSTLGSTVIAQIRGEGASVVLNGMIQERRDPGGVLIGYRVRFWDRDPNNVQGPNTFLPRDVDVPIPDNSQRMIYGCTTDGSLWYTLLEMAYSQQYLQNPQGPVNVETIGNYFQRVPSAANSVVVLGNVSAMVGGYWNLWVDLQGNALGTELDRPGAIMTAATYTTFNQARQPTATLLGIDPGNSYAVISYDGVNSTVTLRNPQNRPGLGGGEFTISLAQFRLLFSTLTSSRAPS